jgi:hypothetical protein
MYTILGEKVEIVSIGHRHSNVLLVEQNVSEWWICIPISDLWIFWKCAVKKRKFPSKREQNGHNPNPQSERRCANTINNQP